MPIELIAAAVVTKFLLPVVKDGAEAVLDSIKQKLGDEAADQTAGIIGKVWSKVRGAFSSEREQQTLAAFEEDPDTFEQAVQKLLEKKLAEDPSLEQELQRLVDGKVPGTNMTGVQVMNAGVVAINDLRNANLSGAQNTTIIGAVVGPTGDVVPPTAPGAPPPTGS